MDESKDEVNECCAKCYSISGCYYTLCDDCLTRFNHLESESGRGADTHVEISGEIKEIARRILEFSYEIQPDCIVETCDRRDECTEGYCIKGVEYLQRAFDKAMATRDAEIEKLEEEGKRLKRRNKELSAKLTCRSESRAMHALKQTWREFKGCLFKYKRYRVGTVGCNSCPITHICEFITKGFEEMLESTRK